ncbi:MAG: biopolymer transporter ExbD [Rhodobacter sp.]|nr:biopolymer transporter ExbD [Rhodobacter sp.]
MRRPATAPRRRAEPTIGLINVVFLMLIFFLIAGTIGPAPDPSIQLLHSPDLQTRAPTDALVLTADGGLRWDGSDWTGAPETAARAYLDSLPMPAVARLLVDRDAPAAMVVRLAAALRAAGAERVVLLGERGAP